MKLTKSQESRVKDIIERVKNIRNDMIRLQIDLLSSDEYDKLELPKIPFLSLVPKSQDKFFA